MLSTDSYGRDRHNLKTRSIPTLLPSTRRARRFYSLSATSESKESDGAQRKLRKTRGKCYLESRILVQITSCGCAGEAVRRLHLRGVCPFPNRAPTWQLQWRKWLTHRLWKQIFSAPLFRCLKQFLSVICSPEDGKPTGSRQTEINPLKGKINSPPSLSLSLSLEIKSRGRKGLMMKPQQIRQPEPGLVGVFVSRSGAVGGTPSNRTSEKTQRPDRRPFLARWGTRRGSELVLETRAQDRREEPTRDCPVFKVDLWINYVFKQKHSLDIKNMPPPSGLWSKPWKLEGKAHLNQHLHLFWSNVWKLIYAHDKVIKCSR